MKEIDQALLKKVIIERPRSSHKGDYGRLLLIGGTYPYGGAIIMERVLSRLRQTRRIFLLSIVSYLKLWHLL